MRDEKDLYWVILKSRLGQAKRYSSQGAISWQTHAKRMAYSVQGARRDIGYVIQPQLNCRFSATGLAGVFFPYAVVVLPGHFGCAARFNTTFCQTSNLSNGSLKEQR